MKKKKREELKASDVNDLEPSKWRQYEKENVGLKSRNTSKVILDI